jgi:hypothetical protein
LLVSSFDVAILQQLAMSTAIRFPFGLCVRFDR